MLRTLTSRVTSDRHHEKVSNNNPDALVPIKNELQNKPNNRQLKKGPDNRINHLSLQTQLLQERQKHRHEHHRGGSQRL
uniref:Uncharacterized protein n=1 Tax=Rhizophora mucronata TaxID=61149 RepID=A0A2P2NGI1_RHIMU